MEILKKMPIEIIGNPVEISMEYQSKSIENWVEFSMNQWKISINPVEIQ